MAPKSKGSRGEDLKQEDVIQAVVFADSFNSRFAPISEDKPRALLPVANVPLLDYTLECLCSCGVQEVFVVCCHLADQIKTYLSEESRWTDASSTFSVVPVTSEGCLSMGDALRDIDSRSLIRSDFILVYGDVVSNIKLQKILEDHKQRREKDKSLVMTMVLRKAPPGHMTRCREDDVLIAVDNQTNNVIHYQKIGNCRKPEIPVEVLLDHRDVQIRNDLLDSDISICSPEVPQLFTDNFDYQTRDDFVRGILINEEIMGNTIQVNVVTDSYTARISNLQMYDAVSRDILNRWTFPFVPEKCYRHNKDSISFGRHNVYLSRDVTLARGCKLEENVMIGKGSSVGINSVITHSIIGRNCKIGENVRIHGSYLWDGVTVEDNCTIETSLLCGDVTVYNDTTLSPCTVLSWQVMVGPKVTLKEGVVVVANDDGFGEMGEGLQNSVFGMKSRAFEYKEDNGSDDDEEEEDLSRKLWDMNIQSDYDEDSSGESFISDEESDSGSPPPDDTKLFYTELMDTLRRAREENISKENIILEINSLKHAYNISIKELTMLVLKALLELPLADRGDMQAAQALKVVKEYLAKHMIIIKNYIKNVESQNSCLKAIEEFGKGANLNLQLVIKIIHFLYESEVLVEQVILRWHQKKPEEDDDDEEEEVDREYHAKVRKQVEPLVKWLQEAEEESSEED